MLLVYHLFSKYALFLLLTAFVIILYNIYYWILDTSVNIHIFKLHLCGNYLFLLFPKSCFHFSVFFCLFHKLWHCIIDVCDCSVSPGEHSFRLPSTLKLSKRHCSGYLQFVTMRPEFLVLKLHECSKGQHPWRHRLLELFNLIMELSSERNMQHATNVITATRYVRSKKLHFWASFSILLSKC